MGYPLLCTDIIVYLVFNVKIVVPTGNQGIMGNPGQAEDTHTDTAAEVDVSADCDQPTGSFESVVSADCEQPTGSLESSQFEQVSSVL